MFICYNFEGLREIVYAQLQPVDDNIWIDFYQREIYLTIHSNEWLLSLQQVA